MSDFEAKMHQIRFPLGLRPDPPNLLAVFKRPTSKGRERERGERGRGGEGVEKGRGE